MPDCESLLGLLWGEAVKLFWHRQLEADNKGD